MPLPTLRRAADGLLVGLFLAAVGLPGAAGWVWASAAGAVSENGPPKPFPADKLTWAGRDHFPAYFEAYFNDRVGFRRQLLAANAVARVGWLHVSSSRSVDLGRHGWLYLDETQMYTLPARAVGMPPAVRAHLWALMLEDRRLWLADQGVPYLFVSVPEKPSVYPEYLPRLLRRHPRPNPAGPMRAELHRRPGFPLINAGELLRRAKPAGRQLFFRTDTHWTPEGALLVYREIALALARLDPRVPPPAAVGSWPSEGEGDLIRLLGFAPPPREPFLAWSPAPARGRRLEERARMDESIHEPAAIDCQAWGTGDPGQARAVMFHDSFGQALYPFLAEHFERITFAPTWGFDADLVLRERPAVVVQESAERAQAVRLPEDPLGVRGYRLTRRFREFRSEQSVGPARLGAGAALELPPLAAGPEKLFLVRAELTCPDGSLVSLSCDVQPGGEEVIRQRALEGRGEMFFVIAHPGFTGRARLALDPPGGAELHAMEVRSVTPRDLAGRD
jgi:hypothetical protein